jgi:hypothetical protein
MPSKAKSETLTAQWEPLVETWRCSGQTQKAFCRERGLSYDQFVYWRRKLAQRDADQPQRTLSALVPVTCAPTAAAAGLSLVLPNGMELRGLTLDNVPVVQQLLAGLR